LERKKASASLAWNLLLYSSQPRWAAPAGLPTCPPREGSAAPKHILPGESFLY